MPVPALPVVPAGVIPPVCTPLTADRELDVASLERLCAFLLSADVAGLFVGGSTGETAYLPDELRARALEVVVGVAAGQVPVFAGVIDMTTPRVVEHARVAEKLRASALVATAPFYAPTHPAEIAVHFRELRAAVDLPLLAYDIPTAVHTKLPTAVVASLAADGTLDGVKDSSGSIDGMRAVLAAVDRPDFRVFTGSETLADLALLAGVHGIVPGLGNVDPHGYVRLYSLALAGDWAAATAEQRRLTRLFGLIDVGDAARMGRYSSAIGAFKAGLVHRGVIASGTTSLPMIPLNDAEHAAVRDYLVEAGLV
ncbi:dihydrodipicolinate synthase family protein [Tenggerimyces flavus]|uniref:Dihydrodipicolinate synthase family protein n=1 Tax=Tenggerimyces flavus TaxID=1708749 RepID=A0ABV7YG39_9ACTN|nr:dihydrodipicolinate synthase family protein [Tenggerimyces flavus]MBM7787131.1 4-hydroxy-tetrahydrodipicolinate synthase [Tenggerimyces flavus]